MIPISTKNVNIGIGARPRKFDETRKLRIRLQEGGTSLWIPEEDAADYSRLGKGTIRQNGTYSASTFNLAGFSEIEVAVDTAAVTGTATATQNGTYEAEDYNLDGFSTFTVDVPTIEGEDYTVEPDETDDLIVIYDSTEDASGIGGTSIDLETGSMYVYTEEDGEGYIVEVDTEGTVTKTLAPKGIQIVTLPTKTSYTEGETMDYTGLTVKLVTKNGTYTDAVYTTGFIPFSELEFPEETAPAGSGGTASIPVLWSAPQPHFPCRMKFRETFEIEVTNNE